MGFTAYPSGWKPGHAIEPIGLGLRTWPAMVELAAKHGWQPELPLGEYVEWCAEFSAPDCAAMADALERALPDIPIHAATHVTVDGNMVNCQGGNLLEQLSGGRRFTVSAMIKMLRAGGIYIA
jgi:hypothetical protein